MKTIIQDKVYCGTHRRMEHWQVLNVPPSSSRAAKEAENLGGIPAIASLRCGCTETIVIDKTIEPKGAA